MPKLRYRENWPANRSLEDDPAAQKDRYMSGARGTANYFSRVQRFNTALYAPADTRPRTEALPSIAPLSGSRAGAGWQQPRDPYSIAARYGAPGTNALVSTYRNLSSTGNTQFSPPLSEAGGAMGPRGDEPQGDGDVPGMPAGYRAPAMGSANDVPEVMRKQSMEPTDNLSERRRRWMEEGGSQRSWNKAGVAMGIRPRIDARAAPDRRASTASDDIRTGWGWGRDPMKLPY